MGPAAAGTGLLIYAPVPLFSGPTELGVLDRRSERSTHPFETGSATKRLVSSRDTWTSTDLRPAFAASAMAAATSAEPVTSLGVHRHDDISGLDAAVGGIAVRVDVGDDEALAVVSRRDGQAEIFQRIGSRRVVVVLLQGSLLVGARQFAEIDLEGLGLAVRARR